jgi:hypothetical protein
VGRESDSVTVVMSVGDYINTFGGSCLTQSRRPGRAPARSAARAAAGTTPTPPEWLELRVVSPRVFGPRDGIGARTRRVARPEPRVRKAAVRKRCVGTLFAEVSATFVAGPAIVEVFSAPVLRDRSRTRRFGGARTAGP